MLSSLWPEFFDFVQKTKNKMLSYIVLTVQHVSVLSVTLYLFNSHLFRPVYLLRLMSTNAAVMNFISSSVKYINFERDTSEVRVTFFTDEA